MHLNSPSAKTRPIWWPRKWPHFRCSCRLGHSGGGGIWNLHDHSRISRQKTSEYLQYYSRHLRCWDQALRWQHICLLSSVFVSWCFAWKIYESMGHGKAPDSSGFNRCSWGLLTSCRWYHTLQLVLQLTPTILASGPRIAEISKPRSFGIHQRFHVQGTRVIWCCKPRFLFYPDRRSSCPCGYHGLYLLLLFILSRHWINTQVVNGFLRLALNPVPTPHIFVPELSFDLFLLQYGLISMARTPSLEVAIANLIAEGT